MCKQQKNTEKLKKIAINIDIFSMFLLCSFSFYFQPIHYYIPSRKYQYSNTYQQCPPPHQPFIQNNPISSDIIGLVVVF
jgi:hypothetical protein